MPMTRPLKDRFEEKIRITPGCWIWVGSKHGNGYGRMVSRRRHLSAHRVSHEIYVGPIPDGMFICHKCDNPLCVNPDHLFLGTPKDNAQDMLRKGRKVSGDTRGEAHARSKLTNEAVLAIRADPRLGPVIASEYGISAVTVYKVKNRDTWRHI